MYTEDDYLNHYLLSLFSEKFQTNSSQLENVLNGRRTPSMLYLTEKNRWFHAYNLFPKINRKQIGKIMTGLSRKKWLVVENDGWYLSEIGASELSIYFEEHSYPVNIKNFKNQTCRNHFWTRFQLLTQIISEKIYGNRNYSPVIRNPKDQEWAKMTLRKFKDSSPSFETIWVEETVKLFARFSDHSAFLLSHLLAGNGELGRTFHQIGKKAEWTEAETYVLFHNALEESISLIEEENTELPLLREILLSVQKEYYFGLSKSAYHTAVLVGRGYGIDRIARERKLKPNTIREHILEIAFVQREFDYVKFIPKEIHVYLNTVFNRHPNITYKELKKEMNELEFMHFRLAELERLREHS